MNVSATGASDNPDTLLRLLTSGVRDHVTILCGHGEVIVNTFLLAALHTITRYIIDSKATSSVVSIPNVDALDIELMLLGLREQRLTFQPKQVLVDKLSSIVRGQGMIGGERGDNKENHEEWDTDNLFQDNETDRTHDIPGDHNYFESDVWDPVIIKIKKSDRVKKTQLLENLNQQEKEPLKEKNSINPERQAKVGSTQLSGYCNLCGKCFLPSKRLVAHLWEAHKIEIKCSECGSRFSSEKKLKIHLYYKHKIGDHNPRHLQACQHQCGKKLPPKKLLLHERKCEKQKKEIPCETCGKMVIATRMQTHFRSYHSEYHVGRKRCINCGKDIINKAFKLHEQRCVHGIKRVVSKKVCTICGKNVQSLRQHMKNAHGDRLGKPILKCDICDYKTYSKMNFDCHKDTHEAPQPCQICGELVKRMKSHISTKHTANDQKKYQCPDCGKGFVSPHAVKRHQMNVHLKLYPYKCRHPDCDAKFNDKANRYCHEKKKHGERYNFS